jgi:hypothetical protein
MPASPSNLFVILRRYESDQRRMLGGDVPSNSVYLRSPSLMSLGGHGSRHALRTRLPTRVQSGSHVVSGLPPGDCRRPIGSMMISIASRWWHFDAARRPDTPRGRQGSGPIPEHRYCRYPRPPRSDLPEIERVGTVPLKHRLSPRRRVDHHPGREFVGLVFQLIVYSIGARRGRPGRSL